MRILQVHNRYRLAGGEDVVVRNEAELLRDSGHEVIDHQVANPEGAVPAAVRLAAAPWNARAARQVGRRVAQVRPHVVHVHNTWFSLSPAVFHAVADFGVPTVATVHNYRPACVNGLLYRDGGVCTACVGRSPWSGVRFACYRGSRAMSAVAAGTLVLHRLRRTWEREVARILVLTRFSADLLARAGLPEEQIVVKPNFAPDPGARSEPPSASGTVLYVGRISEEKGTALLLEAWRRGAPPGLKLVVIGDGPLRSDLERAFPEVVFRGAVPHDEVVAAMLRARALLFPSCWYEAQPMVLLEALGAGLPVLGSSLGAVPEILDRSEGSALAEPALEAWVGVLSWLERDAWLDGESLRGRRLYEERHSPAVGLERLEALYEEVVASGPRPSR